MKKFIASLVSVLFVGGSISSANTAFYAADNTGNVLAAFTDEQISRSGVVGDNVSYALYSDGTLILSGEGDTYGYADFDSPLFRVNASKIIVEEGITSIGDGLFNSSPVSEVEFPETLTSIGSFSFQFCDNIKEITIPASVKSIGQYAFSMCTSLETVYVPVSVENIGEGVFNGTKWLENKLAESGMNIINGILTDASKCSGEVVIPDTVKSIGNKAFFYAADVTSVVIPDSVETIGEYAFDITAFPSPLVSVTMGKSVSSIGKSAFEFCSYIEAIDLPSTLEIIGESAFTRCERLSSISIPDSVTSIGADAFSYCDKIEELTIPASVSEIDKDTFRECAALKRITFLNPDCEIYDDALTISNSYIPTAGFKPVYNGVICGYEGSTAQAYAEKYGYTFEALGETSKLGDVNGDGLINAVDASKILVFFAQLQDGSASAAAKDIAVCDVNKDGIINAVDASLVLVYTTVIAEDPTVTLEEFVDSRK